MTRFLFFKPKSTVILRVFITLALVMVNVAAASAQSEIALANPDSALLSALTEIQGSPIRLADAIAMSFNRATQVRDAKAAYEAATGNYLKQSGKFEPEIFAEGSRASERQPSASPFSGADVLHPRTNLGDAGARITLPWGTELQASITARKLETNSAYASINPEYDATGSLTVNQPLLSGFGPGKYGDAMSAYRARDAASQRYADAVLGVQAQTEETYWDLYAAERDLAVARLIRDRSAALLNEVDLRAKAGLVGPNQVNNAKVFLAQQELSLLDAEDNYSQVSDELASLIGKRPEGSFSCFRTLDEPPQTSASEPEDSLIARAALSNHELKAAEADVKSMRELVKAANWNALPKADLFGALGGNGLSGTGRTVIFGTDTIPNSRNDKFADALDQALNRDYPTWTIGLRVSVPILFREKSGERQRLMAELNRAEQRYIQVKRDLDDRIRAVRREFEHGQDRIKAAEDGVKASLDQVRIGLIEYDNGRTTAFELVRLGADLANAQRSYSQALVRTAKAAARLKQLVPQDSALR